MFKWPNVFDIWNTYLTEFLERYGGTKLERARDLFEQCLETCPEKFAKAIYILYAKLELEHGSAKRGKLKLQDAKWVSSAPSPIFGHKFFQILCLGSKVPH